MGTKKQEEFLFDSSAVVKLYNWERGTEQMEYWVKKYKGEHALSFFIPNVSVAEVLYVLYHLRYEEKRIKIDTLFYNLKASFLHDIEKNKYTIVNFKGFFKLYEICEKAKELFLDPKEEHGDLLNGMDLLIAETVLSFREKHPHHFFVTADNLLEDVMRAFKVNVINPCKLETIPEHLLRPENLSEWRRAIKKRSEVVKEAEQIVKRGTAGDLIKDADKIGDTSE